AIAEYLNTWSTCQSVLRLKKGGKTVGSACLVKRRGRRFLLTARHCMDPQPGEVITVEGFTVLGHPLRHVASFPANDVTVLQLESSVPLPEELRRCFSFELTGSIGLARGMEIMLVGFPPHESVEGVEHSDDPLTAWGHVSWIADLFDEAVGSYSEAHPGISGGSAVSGGPPFLHLAGLHVGMISHEEGRNPQDIAAAGDLHASASSYTPAAPGSDVMETEKWWEKGPVTSGRSCGGKTRKNSGSAAMQQAARDVEVQRLLDNVPYKGQAGVFIPAGTLCELLDRCWELVRPEGAKA
ncbi:hypothetical protein Agub_g173, partial [Astrephomene gubernaculifera]